MIKESLGLRRVVLKTPRSWLLGVPRSRLLVHDVIITAKKSVD